MSGRWPTPKLCGKQFLLPHDKCRCTRPWGHHGDHQWRCKLPNNLGNLAVRVWR